MGISLDEAPFFSWCLLRESEETAQRNVRITVYKRNGSKQGQMIWDSGTVETELQSLVYSGPKLEPMTQYRYRLECTDTLGGQAHAEAVFETAPESFDPVETEKMWRGAEAVCRPETTLFTHSLDSFSFEGSVKLKRGSKRAGLIFAADSPSSERSKVSSPSSYFLLALNVTSEEPVIEIYRYGYYPSDREDIPLYRISSKAMEENGYTVNILSADLRDVLNKENEYESHRLRIVSKKGNAAVFADGRAVCPFEDGMHLTYVPERSKEDLHFMVIPPSLSSVGLFADADDTAFFSDMVINGEHSIPVYGESIFSRALKDGLMGITSEGYRVFGGKSGKLIFSDPSSSNLTLMRGEYLIGDYSLPSAPIAVGARLYVYCSCDYDLYCNGERITPSPVLNCSGGGVAFYNIFDLDTAACESRELALGFAMFDSVSHSDIRYLLTLLIVRYSDGSERLFPSRSAEIRYISSSTFTRKGARGGIFLSSESKILNEFSIPGFDDDKWQVSSLLPKSTEDIRYIPDIPLTPERKKSTPKLSEEKVSEEGTSLIYDMGSIATGYLRFSYRSSKPLTVKLYTERALESPKEPLSDICQRNTVHGSETALFTFIPTEERGYSDIVSEESSDTEIFETRFSVCTFRFIEFILQGETLKNERIEMIPISSVKPSSSFVCDDKNINKLYKNALRSCTSSFITLPVNAAFTSADSTEELIECADAAELASLLCDCSAVMTRAFHMASHNAERHGGESVFLLMRIAGTMCNIKRNDAYLRYASTLLPSVPASAMELISRAESLGVLYPNKAAERYVFLAKGLNAARRISEYCDKSYTETIDGLILQVKKKFNGFFHSELLLGHRMTGELDNFYIYSAPLGEGLFYNELKASQRLKEMALAFADEKTPTPPDSRTSASMLSVLYEKGYYNTAETLLRCELMPMPMYQVLHGATSLRDYRLTGKSTALLSECSCSALGITEYIFRHLMGISSEAVNGSKQTLRIRPCLSAFTRVKASFDTLYGTMELGWSGKASVTKLIVTIPQNTNAFLELEDIKDISGLRDEPEISVRNGVCTVSLSSGKHEFRIIT